MSQSTEELETTSPTPLPDKQTYLAITFPSLSLAEAERMKALILEITPPGETVNIYFDNPIVAREI